MFPLQYAKIAASPTVKPSLTVIPVRKLIQCTSKRRLPVSTRLNTTNPAAIAERVPRVIRTHISPPVRLSRTTKHGWRAYRLLAHKQEESVTSIATSVIRIMMKPTPRLRTKPSRLLGIILRKPTVSMPTITGKHAKTKIVPKNCIPEHMRAPGPLV